MAGQAKNLHEGSPEIGVLQLPASETLRFFSSPSLRCVWTRTVAWSNQAASTGKGKGLVHSKHRVRTAAALTVLNTSF
jgi:hypothetical protein